MKLTNHTISSASSEDYSTIAGLLERVSLPIDGVEAIIPDMLVLKKSDQIVGCAALEMYGARALLRSVAIEERCRHMGWGTALVNSILDLAKAREIQELYLLTETASAFFKRRGFEIINRDSLPESVKNSREFSLLCPESAVTMKLRLV